MVSNELYEELLDAAFEVILLHPGCKYNEWKATLVDQYTIELVDAFGPDDEEIYKGLEKVWRMPYTDNRGTKMTIEEWSLKLNNIEAVDRYYNTIVIPGSIFEK